MGWAEMHNKIQAKGLNFRAIQVIQDSLSGFQSCFFFTRVVCQVKITLCYAALTVLRYSGLIQQKGNDELQFDQRTCNLVKREFMAP